MKLVVTKLKKIATRKVRSAGLNWRELNQNAKQIIVFGSYALSSNNKKSDLDILCIGDGKSYKDAKLHVIWIPEQRTRSKKWIGSELATHVAVYGVWIKGENDWAYQVRPSRSAIARKRRNILARLNAIERRWDNLLPKFQRGQIIKMRRDLQRYQMMSLGQAPVPKTLLDIEWQRRKKTDRWADLLRKRSVVTNRIRKLLDVLRISNA